jgi:hypothetical protein
VNSLPRSLLSHDACAQETVILESGFGGGRATNLVAIEGVKHRVQEHQFWDYLPYR